MYDFLAKFNIKVTLIPYISLFTLAFVPTNTFFFLLYLIMDPLTATDSFMLLGITIFS